MRRFAFRLARELGVWDVDGMMRAMPSRLLSEWMAYWAIEPFGEEREDYRAAMIVAATYNVWRKRGQAAIDPMDVMPRFDAETDKPEHVVDLAAIKAATARFLAHGKD